MIDKRCRIRIYVGGKVVYIYTSLRGQVCTRVMTTPSHNNMLGQCRDIYALITEKIITLLYPV